MVQEISARHKIPLIVTDEQYLQRTKALIESCVMDGQEKTVYFQTMHGTYVRVQVTLCDNKGQERT